MAKTRALPKTRQRRGCSNVLVPRGDVLVNGKVPRGCRFITGGDVMCTPAVAEKVGVIAVKRQKTVRRRTTKATSKKTPAKKKAASKEKGKYCYGAKSLHPYLKASLKKGKRKKLKKGCAKDKKTGKVCCDKSVAPKRRKPVQQSLPAVAGLPAVAELHVASGLAEAHRYVDPFEPGPALALLDDGDLELADTSELALLDESTDLMELDALPSGVPIPKDEAFLDDGAEFALMYLGGTLATGLGLWGTYEAIDYFDYFDDKPLARSAAFMGAGAIGATATWALAKGKHANHIRGFGAAWGIAFGAVGLLGLAKTGVEYWADNTEDEDFRKNLRGSVDSLPTWHQDTVDALDDPSDGAGSGTNGTNGTDGTSGTDGASDDPDTGDDDGEVVTDGGDDTDPGTASPYPYPHPRARFR
ncbi:MAG: hypothetical protein AB8I08_33035 [Sandaracinaceae bacterium]